jgi:hypothetical protein
MAVRGGGDMGNPIRHEEPRNGQGFVQIGRSIVDAGQDVAVKVQHYSSFYQTGQSYRDGRVCRVGLIGLRMELERGMPREAIDAEVRVYEKKETPTYPAKNTGRHLFPPLGCRYRHKGAGNGERGVD